MSRPSRRIPERVDIEGLAIASPGSSRCADVIGWTERTTDDEQLTMRLAVADGATLAYDAVRWARSLVDGFLGADLAENTTDGDFSWLDEARAHWACSEPGPDAPWFVQAAWERGSAATFCGVRIEIAPDRPVTYRVDAVGDTCLFHIRDGALVGCWPDLTADDFGLTPPLVRSDTCAPLEPVVRHGELLAGDALFVSTDALASFILRAEHKGHDVWRSIADASTGELEALAQCARDAIEDDVGFVRARLREAHKEQSAKHKPATKSKSKPTTNRSPFRSAVARLRCRAGVHETGGRS